MATQPKSETTFLERLGDRFNSFTEGCMSFVARLMGGSSNERTIKNLGYHRPKGAETHTVVPGSVLDKINALEPKMKELSDEQLRDLSIGFRDRIKNGATLDSLLPEAFAACREP